MEKGVCMETKKMSGASLMTSGVISFLAGLALLFLTGMSQTVVVIAFAGYAIVLGITQMVAASGEREEGRGTGYLVLLGLYSFVAGIGLLFFTTAGLATVITLVGIYVVITGLAEMIAAFRYRTEMGGYSWLIGAGLIKGIFGVFLLLNTGITLSTFILYVAVYALAEGIVMGVFGYEVREQMGKYHSQML